MKTDPFFLRKNSKWRELWDEENQCYKEPTDKRKFLSKRQLRKERLRRMFEPAKPRKKREVVPHIDDWLNSREVRELIAQSHPCAPKNYRLRNLIDAAKRGHRNIRWMQQGIYNYVHEADLRESLKDRPIYAGMSQSTRQNALLRDPYHKYLDRKPDDGHIYATIKQAADVLDEKAERIYGMVRCLMVKTWMINSKLHVRLDEVKELLPLRPSFFIKRCGLNPNDYKVVKTYFHNGYTFKLHYAPDLIGK